MQRISGRDATEHGGDDEHVQQRRTADDCSGVDGATARGRPDAAAEQSVLDPAKAAIIDALPTDVDCGTTRSRQRRVRHRPRPCWW